MNKGSNIEEREGSWDEVKNRTITSRKRTKILGHILELVNLEHTLWTGITKLDLINYYKAIAPWLLPYLKDRPLALNISLDGPFAPSFFLRGLEGHYPTWANIFTTERKHPKPGKSKQIEWLICNDLATLIYIVNLECIDIHPWGSRTPTQTVADYIVIDLDPAIDPDNRVVSQKEGFAKAVKIALSAKKLLDQCKITSFIKTSGKSGLHIYLPCTGFHYAEEKRKGEVRTIAENICAAIHEEIPGISTISFSQANRKDNVFIDYSQNDFADRVACPYSARHNHSPNVSTLLAWPEINPKLSPQQFTIENIQERLANKADPWKNFFNEKMIKANNKSLHLFL